MRRQVLCAPRVDAKHVETRDRIQALAESDEDLFRSRANPAAHVTWLSDHDNLGQLVLRLGVVIVQA